MNGEGAGAGTAQTPIGAAWRRLTQQAPERLAVTDGSATRTRRELEERSNRLARTYVDLGVGEGDLVTIGLSPGVEFLEAVLAVWKVGATPQPVSHRLPPHELAAVLDLGDPALVVGLDLPGWTCLPSRHEPDPSMPDDPLPDRIAPSLKAPTSGGSTGRPKLIVSTEEATAESLRAFAGLVRLEPGDTMLSTGPLSHNGPLLSATAALLVGCTVVVMPSFDALEALRLVARHRVGWMYTVPTMLGRIAVLAAADRDAVDVSSLRTVITMAAHCPPAIREFCLAYFGPDVMLELYAATEAQAVTTTDGFGWQDKPGSVGRVVVGEIEVRDPEGVRLPPGEIGELWMRRSPHHSGPYRYVGSTPRGDERGWESVGDLGWFDADGFLYLGDRLDDMIVVGGSNVFPAEVEAALEGHPAVITACVVGLPDGDYGTVVHAVLNTLTDITREELAAHLAERLVPYKHPRSVDVVVAPLRDEAGKTRRSRVRAEAIERRGRTES